MTYAPMPLAFKAHLVKGLSDKLTLSHYVNNYGGAVRRLNAITQRLDALDWTNAPVCEINGLKGEGLIALKWMIVQEVDLDGCGEDGGGDPSGAFAQALERNFG